MALRIQNNIASLSANRNLSRTTTNLGLSLERLSSGFRINRAADDAAGLSISQKFRAQIASLQSASRNATEASSVLQVAEGGMEQIHNMLTRLKELATQSASSNSDGSRSEIDAEAQKLVSEIDRIATSTEYNGVSLLNGYGSRSTDADPETTISNVYDFNVDSAATGSYEFGYAAASDTLTLTFGSISETAVLTTNSTVSFGTIGVSFKISGGATIDTVGAALATMNGSGGYDFGVTGTAAQFQLGDSNNADNKLGFSLSSVTKTSLGINSLSLTSQSGAQSALSTIDTAIDTVNTARGSIGANMNRLSYAQANLTSAVENLTASESVIRDVDMALEMSQFTKNQILQQAGVSMLAQANALPQAALSLLS
ncbi:MAG: flagellin [Deferribacteres bacterium]|nr:flagellin [candidate division KSB1 bacterium]MCB9504192.1 flagellin [Deferribacteres bacterium]